MIAVAERESMSAERTGDATNRIWRSGKKNRDRLLFWRFARSSARAEGGREAQRGGHRRLPVGGPERLLAVHTGAERGEFMLEEGLINPREPVARNLNGRRIAQVRESQSRPGPVHSLFDQSCADRVAEHIAEDREEMAVVLNRKTFEAALPDMPMTVVVPMITPDVTGHPPLHERAEGGVRGRLYDQVKMIGHEADAEELDEVLGFRGGKQVETCGVVAVLVEDLCPLFSSKTIHEGNPNMPSWKGRLSEQDSRAVLAYIRTLAK